MKCILIVYIFRNDNRIVATCWLRVAGVGKSFESVVVYTCVMCCCWFPFGFNLTFIKIKTFLCITAQNVKLCHDFQLTRAWVPTKALVLKCFSTKMWYIFIIFVQIQSCVSVKKQQKYGQTYAKLFSNVTMFQG